MADDNKIDVRFTATTDQLKSGLKDVEAQVASTTSAVSSSMDQIAVNSERGSIAMKGFHVAGHELFRELGAGGPVARTLGRGVEQLAGNLGAAAAPLGALTLACIVAYNIWEHFTSGTEAATAAIKASVNSLKSQSDELFQNEPQTRATAKAHYELLVAENELFKLKLDQQIRAETKELIEKEKAVKKNVVSIWEEIKAIASYAISTKEAAEGNAEWVKMHVDARKEAEANIEILKKEIEADKAMKAERSAKTPTQSQYEATPQTDKSQMSKWEQDWQDAYLKEEQEHKGYLDKSLADEIEYWENISKLPMKYAGDAEAVHKKITDLQIAQFKETHDAQVAAGTQETAEMTKQEKEWEAVYALRDDAVKQHSAAQMAAQKQDLASEVALGHVTKEQEIAMLKEFDEQEYQEALRAENDKLILYANEPKKYQETLNQIATLQQKHDAQMKASAQQAALAYQQVWQKALTPITSAFETSINGMIAGTQTLVQAMQRMGQSIVMSFVNDTIKTMVNNWLLGKQEQYSISVLFAALEKALGITSAVEDEVVTDAATTNDIIAAKAKAAATIPAYAALAAIEAASAMASIPYVGPALAAAAYAEMEGLGVAALAQSAAAGGYDIGMENPVTQLHAKEMVLPAHLAEGVRNMTDQGATGGNVGLNLRGMGIKATDLIKGSDMTKILKQLSRNFHITAKTLRHA